MEEELATHKCSPKTEVKTEVVEKSNSKIDSPVQSKPQTIVKPPIFKGTETEDFLIWLKNYDQICKLNGWEEEFKIVHVATVLQEDANRKYWECSEEERAEWGRLEKALIVKFAPESSRASFEATFENRKRNNGESLDKYMTELRALARKAYPDWQETYRDKLVKKYFMDGLDEELQIWVLQANPKTSDDALQTALRSEANLKKKSPQRVQVATMAASRPNTDTDDLAAAIAKALQMTGIAQGGQSMNYPGRGAWRGRGRGRGRGACHACKQYGHFWRDCPNSSGNGRGARN